MAIQINPLAIIQKISRPTLQACIVLTKNEIPGINPNVSIIFSNSDSDLKTPVRDNY
jgi:hypothetical protein